MASHSILLPNICKHLKPITHPGGVQYGAQPTSINQPSRYERDKAYPQNMNEMQRNSLLKLFFFSCTDAPQNKLDCLSLAAGMSEILERDLINKKISYLMK
jgi:hypothetical protein